MSETSFNNDPEFDGFDPSLAIRALEANEDFTREELMAFWGVYVEMLDEEELQDTQVHLQRHASWNAGMQEVLVAERVKRNPPNQVGIYGTMFLRDL